MVDKNVVAEKDKKLPSGWLTKDYSPKHWNEYWNRRVYYFLVKNHPTDNDQEYEGPSDRTVILYALQQRREAGLPDIVPELRNLPALPDLYAELDQMTMSSCEILGQPSPVCSLSSAQYPDAPQFQRECKDID